MNSDVGRVSSRWILAFILLTVLAVFAGYFLFRSPVPWSNGNVIEVQPDPACNLRVAPCVSRLPDGGSVSFAIVPRTIPALEPLQLVVNLNGINAQRVEVDLSGADMFMGLNRLALQRQSGKEYTGKGTIPVCTRKAMEWEATVLIETGKTSFSVPYRFIVINPGGE